MNVVNSHNDQARSEKEFRKNIQRGNEIERPSPENWCWIGLSWAEQVYVGSNFHIEHNEAIVSANFWTH